MSVGDALRRGEQYLSEHGVASPRLDAELILARALGLTRLKVYLAFERLLTPDERTEARALLARRAQREPLAHVLGEREFMSLAFEVTPDVFIPRPETELVVETVIRLDREGRLPPGPLLDIGTGSGAIAVAVAHALPARRIAATDLSPAALAVARRNAARHGVAERIELVEGDLAAGLPGPFAAVASNPPYVAECDRAELAPEVLREPELALFGGPDGLAVLCRLAAIAPGLVAPGGWLVAEIGADQALAVQALLRAAGEFEESEVLRDLAGHDRVIVARRLDERTNTRTHDRTEGDRIP